MKTLECIRKGLSKRQNELISDEIIRVICSRVSVELEESKFDWKPEIGEWVWLLCPDDDSHFVENTPISATKMKPSITTKGWMLAAVDSLEERNWTRKLFRSRGRCYEVK